MKFLLVFTILLLTGCAHGENNTSRDTASMQNSLDCFADLKSIVPGLPENITCVADSSPSEFEAICDKSGKVRTSKFVKYLNYKLILSNIENEINIYLDENPGVVNIPRRLSGKLKNAENDFLTAGFKNEIEGNIEKVRRNSVDCL